MRIGVLSDTHGSLPDRVLEVFAGVDRIIHCGDVGPGYVLDRLEAVAPVVAVRGNCDVSGDAALLPSITNTLLGGTRFLVVHEPAHVLRPLPEEVRVVVTGHTHVAMAEERDGVLWMNPGSPSHARRRHGHHVAMLETGPGLPDVRIVDLP